MKYALVTGGSRGIGRAVCIRLASMGYFMLINYRTGRDEAEKTLELVKDAGSDGQLLQFDVNRPADIQETLDGWKNTHPEDYIEVLINNAGIRKDALLIWMEDEQWKDVIGTNLDGFFYTTRCLLKDMLLHKYGRIVNVVSLSGLKGLPGQVNYSAAKAGIIGATKALAQEVGRKNVTVNAVAPGFISTDMTKDLNEKELKQNIPMNRFGRPEEVAEAICFLASESASYITGEVLSVNGGLYT